ncbi:hypothetical protein EYF80_020666 [Liparis tanakae]|uniref:Uncharacterized protein n=1 Tax=Liparis tanakae TaxID=230148 RepID=A0A4Z2HVT8_9TELE|nr:hypothetical protein EYF80_020666 [Liparis tanakae]
MSRQEEGLKPGSNKAVSNQSVTDAHAEQRDTSLRASADSSEKIYRTPVSICDPGLCPRKSPPHQATVRRHRAQLDRVGKDFDEWIFKTYTGFHVMPVENLKLQQLLRIWYSANITSYPHSTALRERQQQQHEVMIKGGPTILSSSCPAYRELLYVCPAPYQRSSYRPVDLLPVIQRCSYSPIDLLPVL